MNCDLRDIFILYVNKTYNLHTDNTHVTEKPRSFGNILMKWWKTYNKKTPYNLLYVAQHGDKNERRKAVTALNSFSHLKGKIISNQYNMIIFCSILQYHSVISNS